MVGALIISLYPLRYWVTLHRKIERFPVNIGVPIAGIHWQNHERALANDRIVEDIPKSILTQVPIPVIPTTGEILSPAQRLHNQLGEENTHGEGVAGPHDHDHCENQS